MSCFCLSSTREKLINTLSITFSVIQRRQNQNIIDDIAVYLLDDLQYVNWSLSCIHSNNAYVAPSNYLRFSGKIHAQAMNYTPDRDDSLYLLIDNRYSNITAKEVQFLVEESWRVSAQPPQIPEASGRSIEPLESLKAEVGKAAFDPKKVFIVHGHDDRAKLELAGLLRSYEIEPIILHDLPNQGRTIIEKIESGTSEIGFVFVLLTPDDIASINWKTHLCYSCNKATLHFDSGSGAIDCTACGKTNDSLSERARQNVVFELGFFVGKLGRSRTCCLFTGDVKQPSDLEGVLYIPYRNSVKEVLHQILTELVSAGYEPKILKRK